MKAPTSQKVHPSTVRRNTGRPTTNQTSREANRKILAAARMFTARLLENMWRNFALESGRPRPPCRNGTVRTSARKTIPARSSIAVWKLVTLSSTPPTKKPTPLRAFLEPVSTETQR